MPAKLHAPLARGTVRCVGGAACTTCHGLRAGIVGQDFASCCQDYHRVRLGVEAVAVGAPFADAVDFKTTINSVQLVIGAIVADCCQAPTAFHFCKHEKSNVLIRSKASGSPLI